MTPQIDTPAFSGQMRTRGVDLAARRVRITRLTGSKQEHDLSEPANCRGLGRIRHFNRATGPGWPDNPLPIEPATRALGLTSAATLEAQVFQNAVCNWRCWYCYVDFELLSGRPDRSELLTAEELVDLYLAEPDPPTVIDLSGGQPDLVPEWIAWMIEALAHRNLAHHVYVWSDDNLSRDYYFSRLTAAQRNVIETCDRYGKVCCFKGFDHKSFSFNTQAEPEEFERQFELMKRLVRETPLDLYAYATFTGPEMADPVGLMSRFVDRLQEISDELPLRTVPLQVGVFSPMQSRLDMDAMQAALGIQELAIAAWNEELEARFTPQQLAGSICDAKLAR